MDFSFKVMDCCLPTPQYTWPTIALEVGYSESYEDLVGDARLLIEGTGGRISLVFLIKMDPLGPGETRLQN